VPDGDDGVPGARERLEQPFGGRPRSEAVVDPERHTGQPRDRVGGLARPQQRARQHDVRLLGGQPFGERPRLLPALVVEPPQRIRASRCRLRVPDEEEPHRAPA
jgi:hypothetical protein